MKKTLALTLILLALNSEISAQPNQEWITIFIHGTVGLRANLTFGTIFRLLRDRIMGSTYERNVASLRENPFLSTLQPIQGQGLKRITNNPSVPWGSYAFALLFNKMLKQYGPKNVKNSYYTFGWSGLLSYKQRYYEADHLYKALKNELQRLAAQGRYPKIRIVAYSHAGNLTLNLSALRRYFYPEDTFAIDELTIVGMPVQQATSCLVHDPMFKRIYHIYSRGDTVQRLDFFSPCNLISHRTFSGQLPQTLTQIEVRVTAELLRNPHICLPQGLRGTINQSPGHLELWFFGWSPNGYRRNFVFYPLPLAIFIPYIIQATNCHSMKTNKVIIDLRPDEEYALITYPEIQSKKVIPFMTRQNLVNLQWQGVAFHPGQSRYRDYYIALQQKANVNAFK